MKGRSRVCRFMALFLVTIIASTGYATDTCTRQVFHFDELDDYYCICAKLEGDDYPVCHGGGLKYYFYFCVGDCDCRGACVYECKESESTTYLPVASSPNCNDTGWWPPGPECNEPGDCEITGWQDIWEYVPDCECQWNGVPCA